MSKKMNFKEKAKLFTENYLTVLKEYAYFLEGEGDERDDKEHEDRAKREKLKSDNTKKNYLADPRNRDIQDRAKEEDQSKFKKKSSKEEHEEILSKKKGGGAEKPKFISKSTETLSPTVARLRDIAKKTKKSEDIARYRQALVDEKGTVGKRQADIPQGLRTPGKWTDKEDHPEHQRVMSAPEELKSKKLRVKKDSEEKEEAKPQGFEASTEDKVKNLFDKRKKERDAINPRDIENWIRKNIPQEQYQASPNAVRQKAADAIIKSRNIIADPEKHLSSLSQLKDKRRNAGTNPDLLAKNITKKITPPTGKKQQLGRVVSDKVIEADVNPYLSSIISKYKSFKNELMSAGQDPMKPISSSMDELFNVVENVLKLPPLNPQDPSSAQAFHDASQAVYKNPGSVLPSQFLQSTLQSYPLGGGKGGDIGIAGEVERDLGDRIENVHTNKIASILGQRGPKGEPLLKIGQFMKLLKYYVQNPKEVDAAERNFRTANVEAGAGGEKALISGGGGAYEEAGSDALNHTRSSDEESDFGEDVEESDIENEPDEQTASDTETEFDPISKGSRDSLFDDVEEVSRDPEWQNSDQGQNQAFKLIHARNAFDRVFNDPDDLERTLGSDGKLSPAELTQKSSKFLEAVFGNKDHEGDTNLKEYIIKGLSRQYAYEIFKQTVGHEAYRIVEEPNQEIRNKMRDELEAKYNDETLGAASKQYRGLANSVLLAMISRPGGRMTLTNPRYLKLSGDESRMAQVIFKALSAARLGEKDGFKDFLVNKGNEVSDKITAIINSKMRAAEEKSASANQQPTGPEVSREMSSNAPPWKSAGLSPDDRIKSPSIGARFPGRSDANKNIPPEEKDRIRGVGVKPGQGAPMLGVNPKFAKPAPIGKQKIDYSAYQRDGGAVSPHVIDRFKDKIAGATPNKPEKAPKQKSSTQMGGPRGQSSAERMKTGLDKIRKDFGPKKESFMTNISDFFISEGFEMNSKNVGTYLVNLCRRGKINRDFLEEMLVALSDTGTEKNWETVDKKKTSKKLRG